MTMDNSAPDVEAFLRLDVGRLRERARNCRESGDLAGAERHYRDGLSLLEERFGPDHIAVAAFLLWLSQVVRAQGRAEEADTLHQRFQRIMGDNTMRISGAARAGQADLIRRACEEGDKDKLRDELEPIFRSSLAVEEKLVGLDHPCLLPTLDGYAVLLRHLNREAEAEHIERRADKIRAANRPLNSD